MAKIAAIVTLFAPIACLYAAGALADTSARYSEGMGSAWDLLFLNPVELATGTRHDGFVTHRFRVHFLVIGGLVLASSLLHLIPVRGREVPGES